MLIDTHCHLPLIAGIAHHEQLTENAFTIIKQIIQEAQAANVQKIVTIATTLNDSMQAIACAQTNDHVYATVGIHPTEYTSSWNTDIQQLQTLLRGKHAHKIVGIGECGIDLFRTDTTFASQRDMFLAQIELALNHNRALVIHSRAAADETLSCLDEFKGSPLRAVMHCYSYDEPYAMELATRSILLGIGGTITYPKNEAFRALLKKISLQHIILETDAPFLPPQPWRGQQNHPKMIAYIAQYIAELLGTSCDTVASATTNNARILFGIPDLEQ